MAMVWELTLKGWQASRFGHHGCQGRGCTGKGGTALRPTEGVWILAPYWPGPFRGRVVSSSGYNTGQVQTFLIVSEHVPIAAFGKVAEAKGTLRLIGEIVVLSKRVRLEDSSVPWESVLITNLPCRGYFGGRGRIRTPDLSVRSRMLYPTELHALGRSRASSGLWRCAVEPLARPRIIRVDPRTVKDGFEESAISGAGIPAGCGRSIGLASFVLFFN